jgi:hypothetical protein
MRKGCLAVELVESSGFRLLKFRNGRRSIRQNDRLQVDRRLQTEYDPSVKTSVLVLVAISSFAICFGIFYAISVPVFKMLQTRVPEAAVAVWAMVIGFSTLVALSMMRLVCAISKRRR